MMEEHVNKENEVLYPYADKNLGVKIKMLLMMKADKYEINADKAGNLTFKRF